MVEVEFSKNGKLALAFFQKCNIYEQLQILKQIEMIALPKRYLLNIETFQNAVSDYIEYYTDNPIVEFAFKNKERIPDEFKTIVEKIPQELVASHLELFQKIRENEKIKKKIGITKIVKQERRKERKEKKRKT